MHELRQTISDFLDFAISNSAVPFTIDEDVQEQDYRRLRIHYSGQDGELIPAYLLLPDDGGPFTAVLIHHQHNSQRHLGKSEVCGLAGDPLQAFGPALASKGIAVLAPDSICFEDRRTNHIGTEPHEDDVAQHYNEMCYRILRGDTLMRKVLQDSAQAISLLRSHPQIDNQRIGLMGHSYGGITTLFHAPLDERIRFACSSGAACSFEHRFAQQYGIEMASVIPGFARKFDMPDLLACGAQRPFLILSATRDAHSQDADHIVQLAEEKCAAHGVASQITHRRYEGEHALTKERFTAIIDWIVAHG